MGDKPEFAGYPKMDIVALPGPKAGPGAKVDFATNGMVAETWTITRSRGPHQVIYAIDFKVFLTERTITLDPLPAGGTKVIWYETAHMANPLARWMTLISPDPSENFDSALDGVQLLLAERD